MPVFVNRPNRCPNINYSRPGFYFLTICLWEFNPAFGRNDNGKILLNEFGRIAEKNWAEIPEHFPKIKLDEYIIMPDHIHGILEIQPDCFPIGDADLRHLSGKPENYKPERMQMYLSKTIQQYKSSVSREIRKIGQNDFRWQRSFYDHVIRDSLSLFRIRNYIRYNPVRHFRKSA